MHTLSSAKQSPLPTHPSPSPKPESQADHFSDNPAEVAKTHFSMGNTIAFGKAPRRETSGVEAQTTVGKTNNMGRPSFAPPRCKQANGSHRVSVASRVRFEEALVWEPHTSSLRQCVVLGSAPFAFYDAMNTSRSSSSRYMSYRHLATWVDQAPPQIGEEIPTNRRTNRRTDFLAKQAPSAVDLSPRPLTHLPYGCSLVAFIWKHKISLNF